MARTARGQALPQPGLYAYLTSGTPAAALVESRRQDAADCLRTAANSAVVLGLCPVVTLEKTAAEYDRKRGIKWLSCTAK